MHVWVSAIPYRPGHQGERFFGKEVAERPHVPPQRQLHCSLLMLPFKLGHVTPG